MTFFCYMIKYISLGSIAQLGEHLPYKQRVIGSSPIVPTIKNRLQKQSVFYFKVSFYTKLSIELGYFSLINSSVNTILRRDSYEKQIGL